MDTDPFCHSKPGSKTETHSSSRRGWYAAKTAIVLVVTLALRSIAWMSEKRLPIMRGTATGMRPHVAGRREVAMKPHVFICYGVVIGLLGESSTGGERSTAAMILAETMFVSCVGHVDICGRLGNASKSIIV